ncbi:response regulator [Horticoccus luteus]|uniref:Response regulator n=1 Tax=Horticoccus luteus TaxID=2862869 RepID=A0A8F9TVZ1_9BACT|nr:response regulator [Horticoccus luteus]QYM78768.1 response regulator [Horticoccus luteus]
MSSEPILVLYAEDSGDDAFLMQRAFNKVKFPGTLKLVPHGQAAIEFLRDAAGEGGGETVRPTLALLDVKMPLAGGIETLEWIRAHEPWKTMPAVMLTSSSQEIDVEMAYQRGADSYLVKPSNLDDFRELVAALAKFCLEGRKDVLLSLPGAIPPPKRKR